MTVLGGLGALIDNRSMRCDACYMNRDRPQSNLRFSRMIHLIHPISLGSCKPLAQTHDKGPAIT